MKLRILSSRIGRCTWLLAMVFMVFTFGCSTSRNADVGSVPVNEPKIENEFEGDAEERMDWFIQQRTYPFDKIPDEARRKAWDARPDDARDMLVGGTQWQPIGPAPTSSFFPSNWGNTSGRINAIAGSPTDAQLILIGGATGGIWRSTNGGTTFAPTSDSQVDLAVGSIAFAPSNSLIVYAGMGDDNGSYLGTGVLKSTDAGQTWNRVSNATLPTPGLISQIMVHPTDPNRVYAAQYVRQNNGNLFSSGFFYSTDGGVNWTQSLVGLARDLVQHPTTANTIYLAMSRFDGGAPSTGGIWKSTDAGVSWTRTYTSPFAGTSNIKIATTPSNANTLFVLVGDGATSRVEYSVNEGSTWTNAGVGSGFDSGQFGYNCYLFVSRANPNHWYVGTRDLWRSTNTGVNYTNITNNFQLNGSYTPNLSTAHPDQHHFFQSPADSNTIFIANDGGLWKSTDNLATLTNLNASLSLTMFTSIDLHPTNPARSYGGTQDNGTQRRSSASSWAEFSAGDGGQTVIDVLDPTIVFSTYIQHSISRFNSNGTVFAGNIGSSGTFNSDRVAFYPPFDGNGVNSNLYFGTYRLYISTDRGATWTAPGGGTDLTNGGTVSAIGVARSNTNVIYTGSSDGLLAASANAGVNWTNRSAGLPNRFIKSITVDPTNPNTVYVTFSGYLSGHVFKSTNAGVNWTDISGNLPDIPVNTLLIDPRAPATFYVGTDTGVFRSTVGGTTWATYNSGMPPVVVSELDAQSTGLLQAATYGRGAYEIAPAGGCTTAGTTENFDGATVPNLPAGWTTTQDVGTAISWVTTTTEPSSAPNSAFANDPATVNMSSLVSPVVPITSASAQLKFKNKYLTESTFDGMVLEMKVGGGAFQDIIAAGGSFVSGGYNATISTCCMSPISGRMAWTGGSAFVYIDTVVNLPAAANGQSVQFRWRMASDASVSRTGVNVDDVQVINGCSTAKTPFDFDGDRKTDIGIYRSGQWWINQSGTPATTKVDTFGVSSDKLVPADYTGDGKTDIAFFRPSTGEWFILRSENSSFYSFPFGISTDVPVPGDFDGDGKADPAIFRPSNVTWYIIPSGGGPTRIESFGAVGDRAAPGDYDGDGKTDKAIFRPGSGQWWINRSSDNGTTVQTFGVSTDKTVQGDYTGDGKTDVAFWRPSTGEWFILRSENFSFYSFPFGTSTDLPVPGDYDADGKIDAAVFRPSNVTWYVNRSTGGSLIQAFGAAGDNPIPNAYVR